MTHDLLHGDLAAAVVDNVFLLVGLPALLAWVVVRWRSGRPIMTMPAIAVIAVLDRHLDGGAEHARVSAGPHRSRRVAAELR